MTDAKQACAAATANTLFTITTSLATPVVLFGLSANVFLLYGLIRNQFLPGNVRLLLAHLSVGLIIILTMYGWAYVSAWTIIASGYRPVSEMSCRVSAAVTTIGIVIVSSSLIGLGVERMTGTRSLTNNIALSDSVSSGVWVGIAGMWGLALVTMGAVVGTKSSEDHLQSLTSFEVQGNGSTNGTDIGGKELIGYEGMGYGPKCWCFSDIMTNLYVLLPLTGFFACQETVGILLYVTVWWMNKRKLAEWSVASRRHNLQERFQLRRNVDITEVMLPAAVAHTVGYMLFYVLVIVASFLPEFFNPALNLSMASALSLMTSFTVMLYACVHPVIIVLRSNHFIMYLNNQVQPFSNATEGVSVVGHSTTGIPRGRDVRDYQLDAGKNMEVLSTIWKNGK